MKVPESVVRLRRQLRRRIFPDLPEDAWCRVVMHREIDAYLRGVQPEQMSAVEVSGNWYRDLPWKGYDAFDYPEFDLCEPSPIDRTYDVVICEQVLEHVIDPWRAVRTLYDLCRPGGHVVVDTPFLIRIHEYPADYWRFSPDGLRILLESAGLEVIDVRSWGNRKCVNANFFQWAAYRPWSSLRDEPNFPLVVWAFARKPFDVE